MASKGNTTKTIEPAEDVLRLNVQRIVELRYENKPGRVHTLHPNIALSRIQEVYKTGKCTIGTLGRLANAFGFKPYQLLVPSLDIEEPQVVVPAPQAAAITQIAKARKHEADEEGV